MFLAGLELEFHELAKNTRVSAYSGILGVVVPVGLGLAIGSASGMPFNQAAFLGLTLGATSVSISAQTLMELKVLRSRVGLGLLGAAVFDDILVILLLSAFSAVGSGGGVGEIGIALLKMVAFLSLSGAFGFYVLPQTHHLTVQTAYQPGGDRLRAGHHADLWHFRRTAGRHGCHHRHLYGRHDVWKDG